jgi:hypothetical protein
MALFPRASAAARAAAATNNEDDAALLVSPVRDLEAAREPARPPTTAAEPLVPFEARRESLTNYYLGQRRIGAPTIEDVWVMLFHSPPSQSSTLTTLERWALAKYCGGVSHIELAFRDSNGSLMAFTVDRVDLAKDPASGFVRRAWRDPANAYPAISPSDGTTRIWSHRHISSLTPAERLGLMEFCYRQVGKPMDSTGMYLNFMPMVGSWFVGASRAEEDKYYCSQLVACALRWIRPQRFASVDPRRCTPGELIRVLDTNHDMFLTSSFRPVSAVELFTGQGSLDAVVRVV